MAANLLVIQGTDDGLRFELSEFSISIGRGLGCDLRLNDSEVSRVHVHIEQAHEGYQLIDHGSANGTLVNGQSVDVHVLQNGDQVQVGRTVLMFDADLPDFEITPGGDQIRFVDTEGDASQIVNRIAPDDTRTYVRPEIDSEPAASPAQLSLLQTLFRVSEEASHTTASLDQILQSVLDLTLAATKADRGCVLLNDNQTDRMSPASFSSQAHLGAGPMTISRTIVNHVASERQGVRTSDAQTDTRFATGNSIIASGIREAICVPMMGLAEFIGVIYLHTTSQTDSLTAASHQHALTDQHLKLVLAVGRQVAITIERRRYQQALLKAERFAAVGQTITMLSHHVKNILQGVRGGSYLIETGLDQSDNEIVRQGWGIVDRNQTRIYNLVMDMLTYSTEKKPVMAGGSLNEVVGEVCELMEGRAAEYSVSLSYEPGPDVPRSSFDTHGIHRAVLNIVTNAIEAVEGTEGAQVSVATGTANGGLVIAIRDNGPGIPDDQKEKLFHLFESNKGTRGTGLGLAVSRKIMEEHGGRIEVQSEPPNGTLFRLHLPLLDV